MADMIQLVREHLQDAIAQHVGQVLVGPEPREQQHHEQADEQRAQPQRPQHIGELFGQRQQHQEMPIGHASDAGGRLWRVARPAARRRPSLNVALSRRKNCVLQIHPANRWAARRPGP